MTIVHGCWDEIPERHMLALETMAHIRRAIDALPPAQRDVEGWTSEEVCNVLDISETNQRVLLHRARSKVRNALEQYLDGEA
jgi:RNA polymerase sigma-70 factor, ECF subfamily